MAWISETFGLTVVQTKAAQSVLLVLVVVALRVVIIRQSHKRVDDPDLSYRIHKASAYVLAILTVAVLVLIWLEPLSNLGTFLGLVSAGIAIALADLLRNFAGWLYVITRRPFKVDDRIQVGERAGDVIDIRMFRTTVLEIRDWVSADQSTGRIVHIPNGLFLSEPVENFTQGFDFLWHEVPVLVTFESDWKLGEKVLLGILHELTDEVCDQARATIQSAGRHLKIRYTHFTPTVYVSVRDSGVLLTARMLVPVRQRRAYDQATWRAVLDAFAAEPRLELAYPTVRTYLQGPIGFRQEPGVGGDGAT